MMSSDVVSEFANIQLSKTIERISYINRLYANGILRSSLLGVKS